MVTKQPTTTEKGEKEAVCSHCGYRTVAEMGALPPAESESTPESDEPETSDDAPDAPQTPVAKSNDGIAVVILIIALGSLVVGAVVILVVSRKHKM